MKDKIAHCAVNLGSGCYIIKLGNRNKKQNFICICFNKRINSSQVSATN